MIILYHTSTSNATKFLFCCVRASANKARPPCSQNTSKSRPKDKTWTKHKKTTAATTRALPHSYWFRKNRHPEARVLRLPALCKHTVHSCAELMHLGCCKSYKWLYVFFIQMSKFLSIANFILFIYPLHFLRCEGVSWFPASSLLRFYCLIYTTDDQIKAIFYESVKNHFFCWHFFNILL